jgi:polysaccharide biosynthesis protein PslH
MQILFLSHRLPFPPNDGARVRAFHIIRHLSRRHEVTVAALARSEDEVAAAGQLSGHCREVITESVIASATLVRVAKSLLTAEPASMAYFFSPRLARRIEALMARQRFDLVFVYCSSVAPYVARFRGPPKILDFVDMDSQKWLAVAEARPLPMSAGYRLEGRKLQRAEAELARRFDLCTCITPLELQTLRDYGTGVKAGWFPNGVDLDFFRPSADSQQADAVCFLGRMDYFPNQQGVSAFCQDVLPLIRAQRPEATFTIVGAAPPRQIRRLADLPGVTVTGTVPDVRRFLAQAAVSVAPLQIARGTQNKILEAMAAGVPVVASPPAARGVDARDGEHLLVAGDPQRFADAVVRLLADDDARARLAQDARTHVERHYSWDTAMQTLDSLIETCVRDRQRNLESA